MFQEVSHPMWVRGLKHSVANTLYRVESVAPHVGAWIETARKSLGSSRKLVSHPTWVRGLKLNDLASVKFNLESHPTWVRGLKLVRQLAYQADEGVSHPTWVRGLKPRA